MANLKDVLRKISDEALGIQLDPAQLLRVQWVPGGPVTDESRPLRPTYCYEFLVLPGEGESVHCYETKIQGSARSQVERVQTIFFLTCRVSELRREKSFRR